MCASLILSNREKNNCLVTTDKPVPARSVLRDGMCSRGPRCRCVGEEKSDFGAKTNSDAALARGGVNGWRVDMAA